MADVRVRILGDNAGFNAAVTKAQLTANAFAGRMRAVTSGIAGRMAGLFGTAAVGLMVRNTIQWADQLNDTSKRLGVNAEQLQKWEYAAIQTGSSLEKLTATIEKLKKSQSDAARGLSTAKGGLAAFGIVEGDDVNTMLSKIAMRVQSGSFNQGALMDIGGGAAVSLIPALKQWQELADLAESSGVIIKQEQINALEKINDQFTFMSRYLMSNLAPAIQWVAEQLIRFNGVVRAIGASAGAAIGTPGGVKTAIGGAADLSSRWARVKFGLMTGNFGMISDAMTKGSAATKSTGKLFRDYIRDELIAAERNIQALRAGKPTDPDDNDLNKPDTRMRSSRPTRAEVDSLAKVGLFTASGLNAQAVTNFMPRIERHLANIERNTGENGFT